MRIKILVIDDEEAVCEILKYNLEKEGYEVDCAYSAEEALEMDLAQYNLFMVDIMMDRLSGFDFAKRIRGNCETENTPVLFCSALGDEDDVVKGLNLGADDYVTKPFVIGEVLARVRAILRRTGISSSKDSGNPENSASLISYRGLRLNCDDKECEVDGEQVMLTRTEFDILLFFLTHRNRIYSRDEIIEHVWGDTYISDRTVDTNINRLRRKIGQYDKYIVTRQGFGYGFKETD